MKKNLILLLFVVFITNLNLVAQQKNNNSTTINTKDFTVFGEKFEASKVLSNKEMLKKYKAMKKGDSLVVKFKSSIKEVCNRNDKAILKSVDKNLDDDSIAKLYNIREKLYLRRIKTN